MLRRAWGVSLLALAACATAAAPAMVTPVAQLRPSGEITRETLLALNAICGSEELREVNPGDLKLAGGMGTGGFAVDSTSKDAQGWFDYGLALSHAFYHQDAIAAMKKAVEADPDCSLCAWGEAWVRGPTLNYPIIGQQVTDALAAAERARRLAKPGDEKARRLADAMVARYAKTKTQEMSPGLKVTEMADGAERTFGVELAKIAADYPGELELAVLAAHSQLIPVRSGDNAGLMPALVLLEDVLSKRPDDTGAIPANRVRHGRPTRGSPATRPGASPSVEGRVPPRESSRRTGRGGFAARSRASPRGSPACCWSPAPSCACAETRRNPAA
jgi:hypothetical protein